MRLGIANSLLTDWQRGYADPAVMNSSKEHKIISGG